MQLLTFFYIVVCCVIKNDALRCLQCQNLPLPRDCARVVECNQGESCFTEQVVTTSGHVVYNLGCTSPLRCQENGGPLFGRRSNKPYRRSTDLTTCIECCSESFCNMKGCGSTEVALGQRGPYCYNCDVVKDPRYCEEIAVCLPGEVCMLYSPTNYRGLPENLYKSQCATLSTCNITLTNSNDNKCADVCCSTDFCNDQCVAPTTNVAIPTKFTMATQNTKGTTQRTHIDSTPTQTTSKSAHGWLHERHRCEDHPGYKYYHQLHDRHHTMDLCVHIVYNQTLYVPWKDASSKCHAEGGDLIVLETRRKSEFLRDTLYSSDNYSKARHYWIGAKRIANNDEFHWVNGHPMTPLETDWSSNQPSHQDGDNCVQSSRESAHPRHYQWHSSSCRSIYGYICELHMI